MQFGVNVPAMHKVLTTKSEEFPDHVFAPVDVRSDFRRVRRRKPFRALIFVARTLKLWPGS
eukprot:7532291-Karenia_brevis.AAC.1